MRNQNGIDLAIGDRPKIRQSILALLLGMHAAIEDNSLLPRFEIVTVGADLGPTRQVNELQEERQLARSLPRDQTTNSPLRRCPRGDGANLLFLPPMSLPKELRFSQDPRHAPINYSLPRTDMRLAVAHHISLSRLLLTPGRDLAGIFNLIQNAIHILFLPLSPPALGIFD